MTELNERDMAAAVAYAEGDLSEDEQIALELRMMDEPELARAVEELTRDHELFERLLGGSAAVHPQAPRPAWPRWVAAAAALALVVGGVLWRGGRDSTSSGLRLTLAAAAANGDEFSTAFGELSSGGVRWSESARRGGAGAVEEPTVAAGEFVGRALTEFEETMRSTLEQPSTELAGDRFRVFVELERASTIVVCSMPRSGVVSTSGEQAGAHVLFPDASTLDEADLSAGIHCLPRSPVRVAPEGGQPSVDYDAGFTRRRSQPVITVLVGSRASTLDARDLEALEGAAASGESELRSELERLGFTTSELEVAREEAGR